MYDDVYDDMYDGGWGGGAVFYFIYCALFDENCQKLSKSGHFQNVVIFDGFWTFYSYWPKYLIFWPSTANLEGEKAKSNPAELLYICYALKKNTLNIMDVLR